MRNKCVCLLFILFACSCDGDLVGFESDESKVLTGDNCSGIQAALKQNMVIGDKLNNPYSVENMQKAFMTLSKSVKSDVDVRDIVATHKYVMFTPSCHEELKAIYMNLEYETSPFPLDYEISDGWVSVDPRPEFSTNGYSHRWVYIPLTYDLSKIACPYQVLYDVFWPEDLKTKSSIGINSEFFSILEAQSHRLCGLSITPIQSTKASKVTPKGNISYRDTSLRRYVGCEGMYVKAYRALKSTYAHCDVNGDFVCDKSFSYPWTYQVCFSKTDFEIRGNDETVEKMLVFKDRKNDLNLKFRNTDPSDIDNIFYCIVARAAYKYYYSNIYGLERPPMKSELSDRLYIHAYSCSDSNAVGYFYSTENRPYIKIYRDSGGKQRTSVDVYGTVIHELTHGVHWKVLGYDSFVNAESIVKESLARAVQWYITKQTYVGCAHTLSYNNIYTGIIKDMIDDDGYCAGNSAMPENISGFGMGYLEKCFTFDLSLDYIRRYITTVTVGVDVDGINNLFDYWINIGNSFRNETNRY